MIYVLFVHNIIMLRMCCPNLFINLAVYHYWTIIEVLSHRTIILLLAMKCSSINLKIKIQR